MNIIKNFKIQKKSGFTIVELLVVIVVIGILAALTVVSYTGISQKANAASLQSDLRNAKTQLELYKTVNGKYPNGIDCSATPAADTICLKTSPGNTLDPDDYIPDNPSNPQTFSLTAKGNGLAYAITNNSSPTLVIASASTWKQISASSGTHSCAITFDDKAYCWGRNSSGQLGNNSIINSLVPTAVDTSGILNGKTVKFISAGQVNTCAIASDNKAYCWGINTYGQIGDSSTTQSLVPVAVDTSGVLSGKTIKSIMPANMFTCAIASDDQAYCWGNNAGGAGFLGNNSTFNSSVPVAVDTSGGLSGKTIKSISTGSFHTCVIASDNQAYCWGQSPNGELGSGYLTPSPAPIAVDTSGALSGKTIKSISAGSVHTCAIASDDKAYCWGKNLNGELGTNSTSNSLVPVAVDASGVLSGKTIKSIVADGASTCAIASDDKAYCWGINANGELGDNSINQSLVPVAVNTSGVLNGKTISSIASGFSHTCVIAFDNQAYCWGKNTGGQLGNNSIDPSSIPVAVFPK